MCGIFLYFNKTECITEFYDNVVKREFMKGQHRGPENSQLMSCDKYFFGFHRLAINGLDEISNQPFDIDDVILLCNGEIYNHAELTEKLHIHPKTNSDCEVIIHMYKKFGIEYTVQQLDGVFAFILYDKKTKNIYIARDPYGVRAMYYYYSNNKFIVSSELKQIVDLPGIDKKNIHQFNPGSYVLYNPQITKLDIKKYIHFPMCIYKNSKTQNIEYYKEQINLYLNNAVKKRVENCERPIACLLSGGLDSSLITALVSKHVKDTSLLETYSIGLKGSEDLKYAAKVADFLGTKHTEIVVPEEEFFNAIPNVINDISSYDTTTVRASVGNYLIGKYISEHSEAKVIFNGDGSDELTGGYMYFHNCNSDLEFDCECKRLLSNIHHFDVLRSDRSISSHGLEARTPFLDKTFVNMYLSIPIEYRNHNNENRCEKYLLRSSFSKITNMHWSNSQYNKQLLPDEVLWRTKEAFSDGVSSMQKSWYEIITEKVAGLNLDKDIKIDNNITIEQNYYLHLFRKDYSECEDIIPYYWMPKWSNANDSSARTLEIYKNKNQKKFGSETVLEATNTM